MIKKIKSVNGTHLQGYLEISYNELINILGEPHTKDYLGNDVTTEWRFEINSQAITIYDWKEYRYREDIPRWNIGGHTQDVLDIVKGLFSEGNVRTIKEVHEEILPGFHYK